MIKVLENLQNGLESKVSYQSFVTNHRILNLHLSNHTNLEKFHISGVNALDVDRVDERYLISGGKDGDLCIHDLQNSSGKVSYTAKIVSKVPRNGRYGHAYSVDTVQWYPFDTGLFISSGMDSQLKIWDTNTMKPAESFNMKHRVHCSHMSPIATHSLIAAGMQYPHVVLLDPKSGSFCHELRAHKEFIPVVRWSPTCEYLLATGGVDSKIFLWDIRSAKGYLSTLDQNNSELSGTRKDIVYAHNGGVNGLRFTDDGLYLASCGTDGHIRLWDVALSTNTYVNFGYVINNNLYRQRAIDICCNTNPPTLFVPSKNIVKCFDVFSGRYINCLQGHFNYVNCCLYRPSTNQVFTGGNDMNILIWTPDTEQEIMEHKQSSGIQEESEESSQNSDYWSSDEEISLARIH